MIWAPMLLEQSIQDCCYHPSFLSDHRYMLLTFDLGDAFARGPGVWKFNVSFLDDPAYCDLVRSFWTFWRSRDTADFSSSLDWWDQGKFYLRELTRVFSRSRAKAASQHKRHLQRRFAVLQRLFDGGDSRSFSELCSIQEELRGIHLREARASQVRSRCRWAEEGETSSAFFLSLEKKHRAKQIITSIRDPDSSIVHHDPFEIVGTWQQYYDRLFTADACDVEAQDVMLARLTRSLTPAEQQSCEGMLSAPECHAALGGMGRGKTPGSDGFLIEFF